MLPSVTRRGFLRYAGTGGAALLAMLAGCKGAVVEKEVTRDVIKKETVIVQATQPPAQAPLSIEIMHWASQETVDEPNRKAWMALLDEHFHDKYPDVKVIRENHGWDQSLYLNYVAALVAGTDPDLVNGESSIQPWIVLGALLPVDDVLEPIKDNVVPGTYFAATRDGKVYGLAECTSCLAQGCNNDVLKKAGVAENYFPATWEEALALYKQITDAGKGEYYGCSVFGPRADVGAYMRFLPYIGQLGKDIGCGVPPVPCFDDEGAFPAYEYIRAVNKLSAPGLCFDPTKDGGAAVAMGITAYGPGEANCWIDPACAADNAFQGAGPAPVAKGGVPCTTLFCNFIVSVSSRTKYPDECKYYLSCLQQDDVQDQVGKVFMPSCISALERQKKNPPSRNYAAFINEMTAGTQRVVTQWDNEPVKMWNLWMNIFHKVLGTEEPIADIMKQGQIEALAIQAS